MRLIVMYDLEMNTKIDLYEYNKFRNNLIKEGFIMIQQSIYSKICINNDVLSITEKKIKKIIPIKGNIRTLAITEKQYQKIKIYSGGVTNNEKYSNDLRLIEI